MPRLICTLLMALAIAAPAQQTQSCSGKAADCKPRIRNSKDYPDQNCTCYTCESGTPHEKIVCTNDDKEIVALAAKLKDQEDAEWASVKGDKIVIGRVAKESGKTVFLADKEKARWVISNPEDVGGHIGQHVKAKVKVNEATNEMKVDAVKKVSTVAGTAGGSPK